MSALRARYDEINAHTVTRERLDVLKVYARGKFVLRPREPWDYAPKGFIGPTREGRQLVQEELRRRAVCDRPAEDEVAPP